MLLKLRRIAAVLTAALTLAAASIPTSAEANGYGYGPGWNRDANTAPPGRPPRMDAEDGEIVLLDGCVTNPPVFSRPASSLR